MRLDFPTLVLALGAVLASGTRVQDADESSPRESFKRIREEAARELREQILGAWRLTNFEHPAEPADQNNVAGFAIFTEGYMAIVLQARRYREDTTLFLDHAQASAGKWQLQSYDRLQYASMVGHSNFSGDMVFESGATPREMEPRIVDGKTLLLRRPDGALMTFTRLQASPFSSELLELIEDRRGLQGDQR